MFEKQKITDILPSKSGIGKNGKPYSFYKIKTDRHGDKILTTFGNATTEKWKVGDEIEIKVTESKSADGKYTNWNFEIPKANSPAQSAKTEEILTKLGRLQFTVDEIVTFLRDNIPRRTSAGTKVPDFSEVDDIKYPADEINVEDVPF